MRINIEEIRELCRNEQQFSAEMISKIVSSNWLNIWVPEKFGGLNLNLTDGLYFLKNLAQADGSLGWTVTLCCGANYFVRNLDPSAAEKCFSIKSFFGGSGMIGGTAEQTDDGFVLSGKWKYATGAPYLTHFTMNARITKNGEHLMNSEGENLFKSFIVPAADVKIIEDWHTMGMKATATHSFEIEQVLVPAEQTFTYNHFYGDEILDRIPFLTFADVTLAVNFLGMALHLSEAFGEGSQFGEDFTKKILVLEQKIFEICEEVQKRLQHNLVIEDRKANEIHQQCSNIVQDITAVTAAAYTKLGIKVCREDSEYNRVFRDFFTATQHSHFRVELDVK